MADNVVLNTNTTTGATIASDDIAGVQHQLIKIEFGVDGAATQVSASDPLPVTQSSQPLPTGAATAANQTTGNTSLATIAGAVAGTEMQVDVLTLPSIPAGTNNIGDVDVLSLPAIPAGNNNIGDVDVASIAAGTNYIGKVRLTDGTTDTDVRDLANSNALNVAIVNGNGDQITSFGGGTQYTDGDAQATPVGTVAMGTDGANIFAVHTDTAGDLQVDVLTLPAIPAGNNNIGDVDVASIAAGDNNIGNVDIVTMPNVVIGSGTVTAVTSITNPVTAVGAAADGAAVSGNPVRIGGKDGSGNTQDILTDTDGNLQIDVLTIAAGDNNIGNVDIVTMPAITGTVTANAGTDLNTSALNLEATQADVRTAVQLIDDTVATLGTTTYTETTTKGLIAGAVRRDADTSAVNTDNEVAPLLVNAIGALKVEVFSGETLPVSATDLDIRNLVFATDKVDASGTTLGANSGVDIGDVTINNAAGASAVNVQDGGNSLTVDAPVGTPVNVQVGNATLTVGVVDETGTSAVDAFAIGGGTPHDSVDSGNPIKVGGVAVSGSASPTSVASGDRTRFIANQHGIPYHLGGHPNLITREYDFGTAAQTDVNLAAALVAADERIYVTRFEALCDNANTVAVSVRAGFGTASVPTASATGVSGMIASHPGIAAGSGIICGNGAGIIAVGGAGEEPRLTSSAATSGNLHVIISYFLIDETP